MILYNVTTKINPDISEEWLQWMKETHIPEVMASGMFLEHKLCKLLIEEQDGPTFAIQYLCKNMETFQRYQKNHAPALQKDFKKKYEGQYVIFRSLMEVL